MKLQSAPRLAGGRCVPPEETLRRIESLLAACCSYSYEEHRVSDELYWGALVFEQLGMPAMGKGSTSLGCKISTLAEALEWLALRRRRRLPGYQAAHQDAVAAPLRLEELLGHVATVTPATVAQIKSAALTQHWVDGYSIRSGRRLKVPLEYVQGISGTNGLAAGNYMEEAIVQGACEVFERRAAITVVRNGMVVPTIDPASITHPVVRRQLAHLEAEGVQITIKDLSFGGVLPCVGVLFIRPDLPAGRQARQVFKAAGNFDANAALMSCLAEFAQTARLGPGGQALSREDERLLTSEDGNYLPLFWFGYLPGSRVDFLRAGEVVPLEPGAASDDCLADIRRIEEICAQLDKDFVVVDLTDPAANFPVVQVVIPGYSDILPYHPGTSRVLFTGWTRELVMGQCQQDDGTVRPLNALTLFA